jgi:hypothetical protein
MDSEKRQLPESRLDAILRRESPSARGFRFSMYFRQHVSFCDSLGTIGQAATLMLAAIRSMTDHGRWSSGRDRTISQSDRGISKCDTADVFVLCYIFFLIQIWNLRAFL